MGYGFVEYKTSAAAKDALKVLQHAMLDGHQLELKLSNRTTLYVSVVILELRVCETGCYVHAVVVRCQTWHRGVWFLVVS